MEVSYCGKKCDECEEKANGKCHGCRGDFSSVSDYCDIAQCCREKFVGNCYQCNQRVTCEKFKKNENSSSNSAEVQEKIDETKLIEAENRRKKIVKISNAFKWLFFINIGMYGVDVLMGLCRAGLEMSSSLIVVVLPILIITIVALIAVEIIYIIQFKRISYANDSLKTAFVSFIVLMIIEIFSIGAEIFNIKFLASILSLGTIAAGIVYMISFWNGCRYLTEPYDYGLSESWRNLWKWLVFPLIAVFASLLIGIVVPIMFLVAIIAGLLLMIFPIIQLVLMWKTSKAVLKAK